MCCEADGEAVQCAQEPSLRPKGHHTLKPRDMNPGDSVDAGPQTLQVCEALHELAVGEKRPSQLPTSALMEIRPLLRKYQVGVQVTDGLWASGGRASMPQLYVTSKHMHRQAAYTDMQTHRQAGTRHPDPSAESGGFGRAEVGFQAG